jgi:Uma2 family endonuclease
MVALRKTVSEAEYLERDRTSPIKLELVAGEIFAMAGAKLSHNRIERNIIRHLENQLATGACEVLPSDMRVKTPGGLYAYPDITVVCGEPQLDSDEHLDTLLNPVVIIEVLSDSTEMFDRGEKFHAYRTLPSLQEYILIAQDTRHVEHFLRQSDSWIYTDATAADSVITLPSIGCTLALAEVYRKVVFADDNETKNPQD